MTGSLDFDETEARREAAIYETPAAADRRELVREALDLDRGERVLSIGCGPGHEPAELAAAVGRSGSVHGVDRSSAMLSLARRRCGDLPRTTLIRGPAEDLPVGDGAFDAAVAVQVYEYVEALEAALDELARVLRPGGRAAVYDTDFDSLVWRSSNRDRMRRVLETFGDHCERPHLGSELAPYLRDAGLSVERIVPNSILNTSLDGDTFAGRLMESRQNYLIDHGVMPPSEATAWVDDLRELDADGGTFFDLTQYLYVVRKPA